jgi:hypothetical protein
MALANLVFMLSGDGMKRTSLLGFVGLLASVLAGCPIYSGDNHSGQTSTGTAPGCRTSADCGINETCGSDQQCHTGDCTLWGCSEGFTCQVDKESHTASCQPAGSTTSTGTGGTGGGTTSSTTSSSTSTGTGGAPPVYCGNPNDCAPGSTCAPDGTCKSGDCAANGCIFGYTCQSDGTCKSNTANSCDKDTDCTSTGDLCIAGTKGGGVCTAPADQCFDQSQCDAGDKCVAGKCIKSCTADTDCRDGYLCDTTLGICSKPAQTCTITNDCGGPDKVCVGGTCVPRSTGGTCPTPGDVWSENGCIPNQAATFTCVMDGIQDACATGSICLHHSCWISCDAPNQTVCDNLVSINQCKPVDSTSGTHNVCGSSANLGSECGAGAGNKTCSGGKICIDGFCK